MIRKYLTQIFPSIMILTLFFGFFYSQSNKEARNRIKELNAINKQLKKSNDSISLEIKDFTLDMEKSNEIIKSLMEEDYLLKDKITSLNGKINNLKSKYEQANNHANGFDSSTIKQYFSNL